MLAAVKIPKQNPHKARAYAISKKSSRTASPHAICKKPYQKPAFRRELRLLLGTQDCFPMVADFAACPAQLRASVQPAVFKALALTPYVPRKPRLNEHGLPAASFGHQIRLLRLPNERYLWPSRGIALAAAGRSADLPYKDLLLRAPFIYRPNLMFALRQDWVKVCDTFASPEFPTVRTMAILWNGVKIIMKLRATRAESWGNQQILAACKQQLRDLDALALDSLQMIPPSSTTYTHPAQYVWQRYHIAAYFLPFWSEHILDLGRICEGEAHTWAWGLVDGIWPRYVPPSIEHLRNS